MSKNLVFLGNQKIRTLKRLLNSISLVLVVYLPMKKAYRIPGPKQCKKTVISSYDPISRSPTTFKIVKVIISEDMLKFYPCRLAHDSEDKLTLSLVTRKRGFGPFPDRSKWIILSDCLII
jgi:hypothetical protein